MRLNFYIIHYENSPLNIKPNQLEEFIQYVHKMYHSRFNEKQIKLINY